MGNAGGLAGVQLNQDPVPAGALPNVTGVNPLGASDSAAQQYQAGLQSALTALEQRAASPNWGAVAAGFASAPAGSCFFRELGGANQALGQWQEQRRQMQIPIANLKIQMAVNQLAQDKAQGAQAVLGNPIVAQRMQQDPVFAANMDAYLSQMGSKFATPTEVQNAAQSGATTAAALPGAIAHTVGTSLGAANAAAAQGHGPVAQALLHGASTVAGVQAPAPMTPQTPTPSTDATGAALTPGAAGAPQGPMGVTQGTPDLPHAPGAFHIPGAAPGDISAATSVIGSIYQQLSDSIMSPQQGARIVRDMAQRGALAPGVAVPVEQAILQGQPNPLATNAGSTGAPPVDTNSPNAPAQPQTSLVQLAQSPTADPGVLAQALPHDYTTPFTSTLNLAQIPPATLDTLAQSGSVFPYKIGVDKGAATLSQANAAGTLAAYNTFNQQGGLAAVTPNLTAFLKDAANPAFAAQVKQVVGAVNNIPGGLQGLVRSIQGAVAKGVHVDPQQLASKYGIDPSNAGAFNETVLALAQNNLLEAKMRTVGGGNTRPMADVGTADLPTMNTNPRELIATMARTYNNAERYTALASAYQRTAPSLANVGGYQNLAPAATFLSSKLAAAINHFYDRENGAYAAVSSGATQSPAAPAPKNPQQRIAPPPRAPGIPWLNQ